MSACAACGRVEQLVAKAGHLPIADDRTPSRRYSAPLGATSANVVSGELAGAGLPVPYWRNTSQPGCSFHGGGFVAAASQHGDPGKQFLAQAGGRRSCLDGAHLHGPMRSVCCC